VNKNYFLIQPGRFRLDGGAMYGIIPRPLWIKASPPDDQNRIDLALRLWCLQWQDRIVLIDTGIGDYQGEKFDQRFDVRIESQALEKALHSIGISCEQVSDLVLSHLHFDHAAGMTKMQNNQATPVFKNATLHLHREHYLYAQSPTERDAGSFMPLAFNPVIDYYKQKDKIHWLEGSEGEIIPELNLKFKTSMGHTPYLVHPHDEHFIYLADLIPTSHHVHIPWVMAYDLHPGQSTREKRQFLDFIKQNNLTAIFEHDPIYWGAKIGFEASKGTYSCLENFSAPDSCAFKLTP